MQQQKISFFTAVVMTVNVIVGAGLFAGVNDISAIAGSAGFFTWIVATLCLLPVVHCIAKLATMIPEAGGFYRYTTVALGRKMGFMTGWLYFIAYTFAVTTVLNAFRESLLAKLPGNVILESPAFFLVILISLVTMLNLIRLSLVGSVQTYLTFVKMIPVIFVFLFIPFFFSNGFSITPDEWKAVFTPGALTGALFGLMGSEFAVNMSDKIEGGAKQISKIVFTAFGIVAMIHAGFHYGLLQIMGTPGFLESKAIGFPIFIGTKFPFLAVPIAAIVTAAFYLTFFNSSNGILTLISTLLHTLADDDRLHGSKTLTQLNSEGRPWASILVSSFLMFLFGVMIPNTALLSSVCAVGIIATQFLVVLSLFVIQKRQKMYSGMPITIIALLVTFGLVLSQTIAAGSTVSERLFTLSPLIIGVIIGYFLMKPNVKFRPGHDEVDDLLERKDHGPVSP